MHDSGDGSYLVSYRCRREGSFRMHVSLKGAQGAAAGPLPGSPYHVTFVSPWVPVAPQDF